MISVLLADTHPAYRSALARSLSEEESLQIVGQAGDLFGLQWTTTNLHPQVIVLNSTLLRELGYEGVTKLKQEEGGLAIVLFSLSLSPNIALEALNAGVDAFVSKEHNITALVEAIQSIAT